VLSENFVRKTNFLNFLIIAAIYFKNRIYKAWDGSKGITIGEGDKSVIKRNILHALITAPAAVQ
jgi:hypothetical protein